MRRSRSYVPGLATTALSLAIVVACSAPVAPTPAAPTPAVPTPTAVSTNAPTETPLPTASPAQSAEAAIDLTTLSGRIVFDDSQDIWTMNADGTGLKRLTQEAWREFDPTLSPDGSVVVYRAEPEDHPELWVMNVDGSGQHRLTPDGGFPTFSPDGSKIAYAPGGGSSGRSWIGIMNPEGSGVHRLPDTDYGELPAWSPDGKRIAFSNNLSGEGRMFIVDVDSSQVVDLSAAGEGKMVAWSPDGNSILFASQRDHSDYYRDVYVMRPDGSGVRRLTFASADTPAWSPDGHYILFSAPGGFGVMRANGSGLTSLPVEGVGWASFPDWR